MTEKAIQLQAENQRLQAENQTLRNEVERLKDEMVRLVGRNLDLSERLETDVEIRRRVEVARELMEGNITRQRNADLKDDAQLLALIDLRVEREQLHLQPDFDVRALARLLDVSQERLTRLFRHMPLYRTPEAYIDNLRTLAALRLLRQHPAYTIAAVAQEAGFGNVRTMQRRILEVTGLTPVQYRNMLTRDG